MEVLALVLRYFRRVGLVIYGRTSLSFAQILLSLFPRSRTNFRMGYRTLKKFDGLGAQLQRVIAVRGLSKYLGIPLVQPPITRVATHPLDGFTDREEFVEYLEMINRMVGSKSIESGYEVYDVDDLSFSNLVNCIWRTGVLNHKIHLLITHPYRFVDAKPMIYKLALDDDFRQRIREFRTAAKPSAVALHHRQGVGGMSIQPGQSKPRELELSAYIPVIRKIIQNEEIKSLTIFTDAPAEVLIFHIPDDQMESWKGLPGIEKNIMAISEQNFDSLNVLNLSIKIIRGGNPLLSLIAMSQSEILILSNSSFGYVSALLAEHENVFIPKTFWHPQLKGWIQY